MLSLRLEKATKGYQHKSAETGSFYSKFDSNNIEPKNGLFEVGVWD